MNVLIAEALHLGIHYLKSESNKVSGVCVSARVRVPGEEGIGAGREGGCGEDRTSQRKEEQTGQTDRRRQGATHTHTDQRQRDHRNAITTSEDAAQQSSLKQPTGTRTVGGKLIIKIKPPRQPMAV